MFHCPFDVMHYIPGCALLNNALLLPYLHVWCITSPTWKSLPDQCLFIVMHYSNAILYYYPNILWCITATWNAGCTFVVMHYPAACIHLVVMHYSNPMCSLSLQMWCITATWRFCSFINASLQLDMLTAPSLWCITATWNGNVHSLY
jgi:hypothetical protein